MTAAELARTSPGRVPGSKAQRAREVIRERIADGAYAPGDRLVLGQIARELSVSPVPVREAVRMLEAEGLITYEHNVGPQVAILDAALYQDTMQTLALVEGYATSLSAPRLTADDLAEARAVNDKLGRAVTSADPAAFALLNGQFHRVLARRCPNTHVADLCERGWARLRTLRETSLGFVPARAPAAVAEHGQLLELIESGASAETLERTAREHRLATLDAILATLPHSHDDAPAPTGLPVRLRHHITKGSTP